MGLIRQGYNRISSLGRSCQCAHQLRRYTGEDPSSFFDWLGTTFDGLVTILNCGFEGCFGLAELQIESGGIEIIHRSTGTDYRHFFKTTPGTNTFTQEEIERQYEEQSSKFRYLATKWIEGIGRDGGLFVRHDAMPAEQARELYECLVPYAKGQRVGLLVILQEGIPWESGHPDIYCASGIPLFPGAEAWEGDDALWDNVLAAYWEAGARIEENRRR